MWVVVLVGTALLAGAAIGFYISQRFFLWPTEARSEQEIEMLEDRIEEISNQKAEEFIREIESADDLDVLDDYLSPELRERFKRLIN